MEMIKRMSQKIKNSNSILLEGFFLMMVLSGIIGLPIVKLKWSFRIFEIVFLSTLFLAFFMIMVLRRKNIKGGFHLIGKNRGWNILFFILLLFLIGNSFIYTPAVMEDMTLETIRTTLATDTMYQYNPATGRILDLGMYPIYKVITLPLVYSVFIDITGIDARTFLYYIVPIFIIIIQFAVVGKWGTFLFEDHPEKRQLLFVFYAIVLLFGDYLSTTFSYRLLHMGWRGETIVMGICIPYISCLCVQMLRNGIRLSSVCSIVLCFVAGVFIAPIGISIGLQGLVIVSFILIYTVRRFYLARYSKTV